MGSKCSLCADKCLMNQNQDPRPRHKKKGRTQMDIQSGKRPLKAKHICQRKPSIHQTQMIKNEMEDFAFVIDSIAENRPTEREIREHRENLRSVQIQLGQQIDTLRMRLGCIRKSLKYGLVSQQMKRIPVNDQQRHNKVIVHIANIEILNKRLKELEIKVETPKIEATYGSNNGESNSFSSQKINRDNVKSYRPSFVLLFNNNIKREDKKFSISLQNSAKYAKSQEISSKYTFMIEQFQEGNVCSKELFIQRQQKGDTHRSALMMRMGEASFESLTLGSTPCKANYSTDCIAKVMLQVQFIKDEEEKLKELIFGLKEKQEEISCALEQLRNLENYSEGSFQYCRQAQVLSAESKLGNRQEKDLFQSGYSDMLRSPTMPNTLDRGATPRKQVQHPMSLDTAFILNNELLNDRFRSTQEGERSQEGGFYVTQHELTPQY